MSDEFVFAGGRSAGRQDPSSEKVAGAWHILIVDDEEDVHGVTRLALRDVTFKGRPLHCISAYSAAEAKTVLEQTPDIALILLDVVMETDEAGLDLTRWIRGTLKNAVVRIILRTGQPGQAPERNVIVDYDINDYKEKTELTTGKLFTTVIAGLRSHGDLIALERSRAGLRRIIETSDSLFQIRSMERFADGVLDHLAATVGLETDGILCVQKGDFERGAPEDIFLLAGSGRFDGLGARRLDDLALDTGVMDAIIRTLSERRNIHEQGYSTLYISVPDGRQMAAFLDSDRPLDDTVRDLLEIFASKVSVGFSNIHLLEKLRMAKETLELRVEERTRELSEANVQLETLATHDPLTGTLNRRAFFSRGEAEVGRVRRAKVPLSVLMIDIDHFKAINDTHGHGVGDEVIKAVVVAAQAGLRVNDVLGRYGGEEFAVLLPDTPLDGALEVAERIRAEIEALDALPSNAGRDVTASLGAAQWQSDQTLEGLLSQADAALFRAKRAGRNRVEADTEVDGL